MWESVLCLRESNFPYAITGKLIALFGKVIAFYIKQTGMSSPKLIIKSLSLLLITIAFIACHKEETIDQVLYKASKNDVYKGIEEASFSKMLQTALKDGSIPLSNPKFLFSYYQKHQFQPVLVKKLLPSGQLDTLVNYLKRIDSHGLSSKRFHIDPYERLLVEVSHKEAIKNLDEAYQKIVQLELATANNLLNYSNALSFGAINPRKLFKRYFMETKRPDSLFMTAVLDAEDMKGHLDSLQPTSEAYRLLQQALVTGASFPNMDKEESSCVIKANLERLRWRHSYNDQNMVYVNIPAYTLTIFKQGQAIDQIKVVVGTGRNTDGKDIISKHTKPVADHPHPHETPILTSLIHSVQVNPVWNIPESIATKEILKQVQADRFYLANKGIDVLQDGKVIEDSELIDWSAVSEDKLPYRFRQRPGNENALGKIKFLFNNNSSVYLHDTPSKAFFARTMRAASHGCVRVEEPMELAQQLFGEGEKFNTIKDAMEAEQAEAKDIRLEPKVTVVLDYKTVVVDKGRLIHYPDVYGLDIVLYTHLIK